MAGKAEIISVVNFVNHYEYYNFVCGLGRLAGPSGGTKYESKVAKKVPYISVMPPE